MTQQEVAEMAGVSRNTVVSAEAGNKVPQADKLWRIMIALDLGPDPADSYPEDVHTWLAILGPLIANLPAEKRGDVMLRLVTSLGEEIAGRTARFSTGMTRGEVDAELTKAQRLGVLPTNGDNVHHLTQKNQGHNPDGMPPFDPTKLLAAREVPDDLSSLRPKSVNPEDIPDPEGPESGA